MLLFCHYLSDVRVDELIHEVSLDLNMNHLLKDDTDFYDDNANHLLPSSIPVDGTFSILSDEFTYSIIIVFN